jgi:hypothetical protein
LPKRRRFPFKAELDFILQCADFYAADQTRYDGLYPVDRDAGDPADPDARIEEAIDAHKVWTARRFVGRPDDRECLKRMADDRGIDAIAAKIGVTSKFEAKFLIGEVLSARRLAEIATETPADHAAGMRNRPRTSLAI